MPFFPDTLNGWLSLVVQFVIAVAATVAFVVRFVRTPLEQAAVRDREAADARFKDHGERVGRVEQSCSQNHAQLESLDRSAERLHLQVTGLAESYGRHDERLEHFLSRLEAQERERLAEDRQIGERLARIETRLDVQDSLKRVLERFGTGRQPQGD